MQSPILIAATASAFLLTVPDHASAAAGAKKTESPPATTSKVDARVDAVLTLREAAELLRIDTALLERMAAAQQLPARQVGADWRFSRSALFAWLAGGPAGSTVVVQSKPRAQAVAGAEPALPRSVPRSAVPLNAPASMRIAGRGTTAASNIGANEGDGSPSDKKIGEAPAQRTASEVFLREQRLLLAPRELTLDIGAFYTRRDALLLTRAGDATTLANAESDAYTTQITARYGLRRNTEIWASTSYGYQRANIFSGTQVLNRASRSEAGDVGLGLRQTLIEEGAGRPDVVVSVDARIPTGKTSPALGAAVSLIKSVDPVVLFGTLGYRHTFSREFQEPARLEPRDRVDFTLGYSFALNDTLSINSAISNSFARATTFSNAELRSSNAASLQLGMTARIAKGLYLQPSVGFRLNGPTRGYTLGLNMPITF